MNAKFKGLILLLFIGSTGPVLMAQKPVYVPNELYVALNLDAGTVSSLAADDMNFIEPHYQRKLRALGSERIERPFVALPEIRHIMRVKFRDSSDLDAIIESLRGDEIFAYAERIPCPEISSSVTDEPSYSSQQYFNVIQMKDDYWYIAQAGTSVRVAVIDNAIRTTHEEIRDNLFENLKEIPGNGIDDDNNGYIDDVYGVDVADKDNDPGPPHNVTEKYFAHGTYVAGILCANPSNSKGIASLGVNVELIAVKAVTSYPEDFNDISITHGWEGIAYAIAMDAQVINCSWGTYVFDCITCDTLINIAKSKGILIVAAAGNGNADRVAYPASHPGVIGVGSTNNEDFKSSFSNYGSGIDVMAPGEDILSTFANSDNGYGIMKPGGTSYSTPIVSGFLSMLISIFPSKNLDTILEYVKVGCDDIDRKNTSYEGKLGYGRINVDNTIRMLNPDGVASVPPGHTPGDIAFNIYPNPGNGHFNIYTPMFDMHNVVAEISDMQGRHIASLPVSEQGFDLEGNEGTYILYLKKNQEVLHIQKLVVIR